MVTPYRIPCSRPEHFQRAIEVVEAHFSNLNGAHPCRRWLDAARPFTGAAHRNIGDPSLPASADAVFQRFASDEFMPAARLCRLARSLDDLARLKGSPGEELTQMRSDADGFFHGEFLLHVASKLAHAGAVVEVIPREGMSRKTPDIALPAAGVAIEVVSHERVESVTSTTDDFQHADSKFTQYFVRDRADWFGVIGVDLGFRGSPTLPDLGLAGPTYETILNDMMLNFEMYAKAANDRAEREFVDALILSWTSVECRQSTRAGGISATLCASDVSGLKYAPKRTPRPILNEVFHEFPDAPDRIAYRSPTAP